MTDTADERREDSFTEAQLIPLLQAYLTHRRTRDIADRAMKLAAGPIRDFLEKHGGQLFDGENRITAALQDKRGTPEADLMTMAEAEPNLVTWLAEHGLLKVDWTAAKALDGKAPELLRLKDFTSPGPGSQSLRIERER